MYLLSVAQLQSRIVLLKSKEKSETLFSLLCTAFFLLTLNHSNRNKGHILFESGIKQYTL